MGQKVNPKLYKFGISNFLENINIPNNNKIVNFINYNYLFNLVSFFFIKYNIEVYFFKAKIQTDLYLNIYTYNYRYMRVLNYNKKIKKKKLNYFQS